MKNRLILFLGISLGSLLFLAILLFSVAQMDFFQDFLMQRIVIEAQQQGVVLEAKGMKVLAPFKWKVQKLSFTLGEDTVVYAHDVRFKISPLSLVKKKLTLRSLSAETLHIAFTPSSSTTPTFACFDSFNDVTFTLPFDLYAKSIVCKHITVENLKTHDILLLSFSGRAKVDRLGKEINADFLLKEVITSNYLEVVAVASQKNRHLEATAEIKLASTQKLSQFLGLSSLPSLKGTCKVHGGYSHPLSFQMESHIESLHVPNTSCFTGALDCEISGELFLDPTSPTFLSLHKILMKGPDVNLMGSLSLSSEYKPLSGDLSFSLKDTSNFYCSLPFHGELEAKVHLDTTSFLANLYSPSLTLGKEIYEPVSFELSAAKEEDTWLGSTQGSFDHKELPLKESCHFTFEKGSLRLVDFSINASDAKIGGTATYSLLDSSFEGSFFIMAEELRPFRLLFPHSEVDGKLGGSFTLAGNAEDLTLNLSCLLKNVRYQNSLVEMAQIDIKLDNLLTSPFGLFSCDAKNIFFRDMLLSNVFLLSEPAQQDFQTFSLLVEGDWKQEILLHSSGLWKKEGPCWHVQLGRCNGTFLRESFALQNPFSIQQNEQEFLIEPCVWNIGKGTLSTEFRLSQEEVSYKGEGNHIPLGILGVLYPKMAFQGMASFQSALSGHQEDLNGHFFISLEKADFSQNRAKGSMQIHLSSLGAQIYSHLYATNNQFLDWTATLPLTYSLAPFAWKVDPIRPMTSELTMQGAVEEIFDFVNTASHKATGWITTHLFLSGTLKEPALLGSLQCEQGTYANYFTGTDLKNIEGKVEASGHALTLSSFKASDEKEGVLTAEGSLLLSPKQRFPFDLKTDLKQMHAVHSDLIDASLSGFLHIEGDTASAKASGDLTVDHALFKIFDELPYEVPVLPVTYINKPIHLQTEMLQPQAPYPLYIDVQLSSEDTVFVQGRGLDSNWHGSVQLTGTVVSPAAKGSLTLKKGEFVFSGKTFTLRQGEISFFDKPSPGAYLKINGELVLPAATILAQMQGPLTSPQLTFQAIPALPTSSILSFILFDKDISEISALQALQLAQTIVSLSGNGGPGVLESIRKKIGVDRLNIVGKDGTDEISVQIGWYLSHGITLSLSQSATSSDVTVEVDLKNGFIFQAETQNQEEGKFSFKWNKNY